MRRPQTHIGAIAVLKRIIATVSIIPRRVMTRPFLPFARKPPCLNHNMKTQFFSLRLLSDDELIARVNALAGTTREVSALLIAHLAEMEKRKLHLPEGCSSLFTYCTRILKFSEHEAYGRIKAARVATRFPIVLDRLADGSLNMTAVVLLSPHLTAENHQELFAAARYSTRQEVEKLVATLRPLPDVPTIIRKLPALFVKQEIAESLFSENAGCRAEEPTTGQEPASIVASAESPAITWVNKETPGITASTTRAVGAPAMPNVSAPARPTVILALAPDRYKLQVTISESTQQKLRQAQELIRHQIPDGNTAEILDRALDLLVEKLKKQKFGGTGRKKRKSASS